MRNTNAISSSESSVRCDVNIDSNDSLNERSIRGRTVCHVVSTSVSFITCNKLLLIDQLLLHCIVLF